MKWISVEDRLPELNDHCIVCRKVDDGEWWFGCCPFYDFGFPYVAIDDPNPITHWMSLPPPPESE